MTLMMVYFSSNHLVTVYTGQQSVGGGSVLTNFPGLGDRQLTIRTDPQRKARTDLDLNNVRYWIKFTSYGPIAYNVVGSDQDEVARLSRSPSAASFVMR